MCDRVHRHPFGICELDTDIFLQFGVDIGQKDNLCSLIRKRKLWLEVGKHIQFQLHGRSLIGIMSVKPFPIKGLSFGELQALNIDFPFFEKIDRLLGEILAHDPDDFRGGDVWLTRWHGIAPTAWLYFAETGGPFVAPLPCRIYLPMVFTVAMFMFTVVILAPGKDPSYTPIDVGPVTIFFQPVFFAETQPLGARS